MTHDPTNPDCPRNAPGVVLSDEVSSLMDCTCTDSKPDIDAVTAMEVLRKYQRQLDPEGIEVGVSRQALDETPAAHDQLQARVDALEEYKRAIHHILRHNFCSECGTEGVYDHEESCVLYPFAVEIIEKVAEESRADEAAALEKENE